MLNRDPELKERRGYTDPKSYVRFDGSEVLHGQDWERRKLELWRIAEGRCQYIEGHWLFGRRCSQEANDPHHVIPRSKGRDDRLSNLQALCRFHHDLLDSRKIGGRHATANVV